MVKRSINQSNLEVGIPPEASLRNYKAGLRWMFATGFGFILGTVALATAPTVAGWLHWEAGRSLLGGAFFGLTAGAAQWLVLRRILPQSMGWIWASAIGSAIGFTLLDLRHADHLLPLYGPILGASVGITQWLVLRRQVAGASFWIMTCMLSALFITIAPLLVMSGISWTLGTSIRTTSLVSLALGLACLAASGGIQGSTLIWLLEK